MTVTHTDGFPCRAHRVDALLLGMGNATTSSSPPAMVCSPGRLSWGKNAVARPRCCRPGRQCTGCRIPAAGADRMVATVDSFTAPRSSGADGR